MRIGVPREIKVHEYRVGLVPAGVRELAAAGHEVLVETGAGDGIGMDDAVYRAAGATICANAIETFGRAELIVKVKEPQAAECALLRSGQTLFTYLHLAADPAQAQSLMKSGVTAIAYETVTNAKGTLPLLTPMSEVAGRMAVQAGAHFLQRLLQLSELIAATHFQRARIVALPDSLDSLDQRDDRSFQATGGAPREGGSKQPTHERQSAGEQQHVLELQAFDEGHAR